MVDANNNNKRSVCFKYNITGCSSVTNGTAATTSNEDHDDDTEQTQGGGFLMMKEQDRLLPIANVGRIMKQILPPNAKISKEGKETMQECVSEFISFVTGEASDKCMKEKRKTINGDDICWALGSLGFDDYSEPLQRYLNKYREAEGERGNQNSKGSNTAAEEQRAGGVSYSSSDFTFNFMGRTKGLN